MPILDANGKPAGDVLPDRPKPSGIVEVVRSVSFKLNLGNYQSMDFFCSQKAQCLPDEADQVSADLYEWCYDQVMESANEVKRKQAAKEAAMAAKNQRSVA
jgi:hypothetical protein